VPRESFATTLIAWSLLVGGVTFFAAPQLELAWALWTRPPEEIAAIERSRYFAGCNDARAAGAAPIYRGTPGYRPEMDGDNDGIACEPHY
jgi:hypothetical protein